MSVLAMSTSKLGDILVSDYRGPKVGFNEVHILKAILEIGATGQIGRGKLGSVMGIGQGEVRTLIKRLKDSRLITVKSNGCALTEKGEKEYAAVSRVVPWYGSVDAKSLGLGTFFWAILVRNKARKVRKGIEQRDASIRAGALGALTVVYSAGKFRIPSEGTNCESKGPSEPWRTIRNESLPQDGDVIIVSGADALVKAEYGGWSAALTLL